MQEVYIHFLISKQIIFHDSFLEEILGYMSGIILNFCIPVQEILCDIAKTHSFANCHTASQTHRPCFFSLFMCWINSTPRHCTFTFYIDGTRIIPYFLTLTCGHHLDPSLATVCVAVLSVLLMLRLVIHRLCYHSRLLFPLVLSFSKQSSMKALKAQHLSF